MNTAASVRWPAIAALTGVSALAQIGQFGIGFMVLPVWLAHQGLDAPRAGLFAASQWSGMLAGLIVAPALVARIGPKLVVSLGLAATIVALATLRSLCWPLWLAPGVLTGFGIGLRWIANESWLYSLVPDALSGRVVGVHETLIASAGVIAPVLATGCGVESPATLIVGIALCVAAAIPLWLTASAPLPVCAGVEREPARAAPLGTLVCLGMVVVAAGGVGDGALYGLFPLYADARGVGLAGTTLLLSCLGLGGMALQFPVGWLADRAGLAVTVVLCAAASTLALLALAFAATASWWFPASAFVIGGMNSAFITLGMYAAARSDKLSIVRNMRLVSLAFTASSIAGPLVAGAAMKALGNDMLIVQLAIASGALAAYTLGLCEGRRQGRHARAQADA